MALAICVAWSMLFLKNSSKDMPTPCNRSCRFFSCSSPFFSAGSMPSLLASSMNRSATFCATLVLRPHGQFPHIPQSRLQHLTTPHNLSPPAHLIRELLPELLVLLQFGLIPRVDLQELPPHHGRLALRKPL